MVRAMESPPPYGSTPAATLRVTKLRARGFRNLRGAEGGELFLEFGDGFNVVHGENGAGKSNLLEALDYLGTLSSFRGAKTESLVGIEEESARIDGLLEGHLAPRRFGVQLSRSAARKVQIDGKRPRSIAMWRGAIHVVLFHPGHLSLTMGAPSGRRDFLDRILEQLDATYASALAAYRKALRSRNRLLKQLEVDRRSILAFDPILAQSGAILVQVRQALIQDLAPRIENAFGEVMQSLPLRVQYQPRVPPDPEIILKKLAESYPKDRARGFTVEGPHSDDLGLQVKPQNAFGDAKHLASQGQHRAMVLSLKMAELDVLQARSGRVPLLLLDDVSSELDRGRNKRLFERLARLGGQVFLTTTHPDHIVLEHGRTDFRVEAGVVERVEE